MNILVSGGAGFVGGNLCKKLKEQNHNVIVIDDLSTGSKYNLIDDCKFYPASLSK